MNLTSKQYIWSEVGNPASSDAEILSFAKNNNYVVFTHDLDFGTILAATKTDAPSVIQIRTQDVMPKHIGSKLVKALEEHQITLEKGALLTIDELRSRIRILPIHR